MKLIRHYPLRFKLKHCLNSNEEQIKLSEYLRKQLQHMQLQSNLYFQSQEYDVIIEKLQDKDNECWNYTSLNKMGRELDIAPFEKSFHQSYNFAEMFRHNIMQVSFGYLQKVALQIAIQNTTSADTATPPKIEDIRTEYENLFPQLAPPTSVVLKKTLENRDKAVKPYCHKPTLPFYAADGHYTKVTLKQEEDRKDRIDNNYLFFKINLPNRENFELKFKIPTGKRFHKIKKICKPIVYLNDQNELIFNFAVEVEIVIQDKQASLNQNILGIDLGKVEPFVASLISSNDNSNIHAPFFANKKINKLTKQIDNLYDLFGKIVAKEELCIKCNQKRKADVLAHESKLILAKIQKLKHEQATQIAVNINQIAEKYNAIIAFENLAWLEHVGGKWNHSEIQSKTEYLSKNKVVKVPAAYTSQNCSYCFKHNNTKNKISYDSTTRKTKCKHCKQILDRDVNASRNIAYLALISLKKKSDLESKNKNCSCSASASTNQNPDLESINNAINGNRLLNNNNNNNQPVKSTENVNETIIDEFKQFE